MKILVFAIWFIFGIVALIRTIVDLTLDTYRFGILTLRVVGGPFLFFWEMDRQCRGIENPLTNILYGGFHEKK